MIKYFENKGMAQALSAVSTNYGSQLDCVFTKSLTYSCGFYESYFSDHKPMLISLGTVVNDYSNVDNQPIISHATSQHDIIDINLIPDNNTTNDIQDVIVSHVCIPTPVLPPVDTYNNADAFTFAMRQSLAQCINLQRIPLRPTNYTGCRVSATRCYDFMRTNVRYQFHFRIVPVTGDGNCFFRTLSHIIFVDESEHHNIRGSLIDTLLDIVKRLVFPGLSKRLGSPGLCRTQVHILIYHYYSNIYHFLYCNSFYVYVVMFCRCP